MTTSISAREDRALSRFYEARYLPQRHLGKSKRTVEETRSQIRVFNRFFARHLAAEGQPKREAGIDDLSDELLASAMAWLLERRRSPATANKLYRVMTSLWRFAYKKRLIGTLPELERLREDTIELRTWTAQDYAAILEATESLVGYVGDIPAAHFWRALILVIVNTAGRITAVMRTRVKDVDLARNEILLKAINQKQRCDQRFELQPAVLSAILATKPEGREFLFPWPYDKGNRGRQWQTLRRQYRALLRRADLPHGPKNMFHSLRAFTATVLADAKGEEFARDYLGHSHVSVTRRYFDRGQMRTKRSAVTLLPEPPAMKSLRVHEPEAS